MDHKRFFIRRIEAENNLEIFLISAVSAILLIRLFLRLSGYPQLGGERFHIAHMLWGGLFMLAAIFLALAYIGRKNRTLLAVVGGLGFGTFLDELGKFITHDNNYFYQPTISLIYIIFIFLFMGSRSLLRRKELTETEYLLNAVEQLEEVAVESLDEEEKKEMQLLLDRAGRRGVLVIMLQELLDKIRLVPVKPPGPLARFRILLREAYLRAISRREFSAAIIMFFVAKLILTAATAVALIFFHRVGLEQALKLGGLRFLLERAEHLKFIDIMHLSSTALSGIFVLLGILRIPFSRAAAYRAFERSTLVDIFLTQIFVFYREQFAALTGLFLNILIWAALRYMTHRERLQESAL